MHLYPLYYANLWILACLNLPECSIVFLNSILLGVPPLNSMAWSFFFRGKKMRQLKFPSLGFLLWARVRGWGLLSCAACCVTLENHCFIYFVPFFFPVVLARRVIQSSPCYSWNHISHHWLVLSSQLDLQGNDFRCKEMVLLVMEPSYAGKHASKAFFCFILQSLLPWSSISRAQWCQCLKSRNASA